MTSSPPLYELRNLDVNGIVTSTALAVSGTSSGSFLTALSLVNTAGAANSDVLINMTPGNLSTGRAHIRAQAPGSSNTYLAFYTSHANAAPVMRLYIDDTGNLNHTDATNMIFGSTTGTKIGTATSQKLAFYNSTPIVQPTGDVITGLQNLGLIASATISESDVTSLTSDLALKAPLASPVLTGTPAAPTASARTNTTQLATTAYVDSTDVIQSTSLNACTNTFTFSQVQYGEAVIATKPHTITKMQIYLEVVNASNPTIELGIYDSSLNLLSSGTVVPTAKGFWTVTLSSPVTLTTGTSTTYPVLTAQAKRLQLLSEAQVFRLILRLFGPNRGFLRCPPLCPAKGLLVGLCG